jgi:hypothetical protein
MDNSSRVGDFLVENFVFGDGNVFRETTSFLEEG